MPTSIAELARLKRACQQLKTASLVIPENPRKHIVNPALTLLECTWQGLAGLLAEPASETVPQPGQEYVLAWVGPKSGVLHCRAATPADLLAIKIVAEDVSPREAARQSGSSLSTIQAILQQAVANGLVLPPLSRLVRSFGKAGALAEEGEGAETKSQRADVFTLQWHITQQCDLSCKHCYDRSRRSPLSLAEGIRVLDDLYDFCAAHAVIGQVSFTGGNPFLHKDFVELYQQAAQRGLLLAILGNPVAADKLDEIVSIRPPEFYQVSLEGLAAHNDAIRGGGHFKRILAFLDLLRERGLYSMVMLTLTRDNLDQVLPLAELLRDRADLFTFNRLSLVGEGAGLAMADRDAFRELLGRYCDAMDGNPVLAMKDNFFNLILRERGKPLFGGCAGYGCGAAFNFVSLLPDGEVHACRKFPSLIGNAGRQSLTEIYHSDLAERYRRGPEGCHACSFGPVCRGCLAVSHSVSRDVFTEPDPYCFVEQ